jgi:aldehyde:ferredoxin oxidoreductase
MSSNGGYTGRILYVDLDNKSFTERKLPKQYITDFIGGAGINTRLLYDLTGQDAAPLSGENALVFGAGPFVGTFIPGSAKCNVSAKSPLNGLFGISGNGMFGMLKYAGYDHLVITGKSDRPVYIKIINGDVQFCDAAHLWGKDVWETTDQIWLEAGKDLHVSAIGPAGENQVMDAGLITNKYAAFARTGMGAILGYKNVKAIAIYGDRPIKVAEPKQFEKLTGELFKDLLAHPNFNNWRKLGTLISLETFAGLNIYAYKNYKETMGKELLDAFPIDSFLSIKEGDVACLSCPIGCKHHLSMGNGQGDDLEFAVSCMNSVVQSFGSFCGLSGWPEVISCAAVASRMGLDFFSTGNLISFAMELYEKGIVTKEDVNHLELNWGNAEAIRELTKMIACKQGFGKVLAEGLQRAGEIVGSNAADYAIQIKGLGLTYDPRVRLQSTEIFSQVTNVRGGHHSNVSVAMVERTPEQIRRFCQKVGVPDQNIEKIVSQDGYSVARLSKWTEDITMVMESLGMCYFPLYQRFTLSTWAELYTALTGLPADTGSFIKASQNIWDLRKAYNVREGAGRENDRWPKRFLREKLVLGDQVYPPLQEEHLEKLLSDYYDERGWDPLTGIPARDKLKSLGVEI